MPWKIIKIKENQDGLDVNLNVVFYFTIIINHKNVKNGFIKRLMFGDYGLYKTYWVLGYFVGAIASPIIYLIESGSRLQLLAFAHFIYQFIVYIGIWNAAKKYEGLRLWAVLAKITSVFGILFRLVNLINIGKYFNFSILDFIK